MNKGVAWVLRTSLRANSDKAIQKEFIALNNTHFSLLYVQIFIYTSVLTSVTIPGGYNVLFFHALFVQKKENGKC